tara:strand:- start:16 stop:702 length:687 start_codon:yes stop_codon:yes gene_type:complete
MRVNREWINISDLMAGLMMVFLFISIVFMRNVQEDKKAMAEIALEVQKSKVQLNNDLNEEFKEDLIEWEAKILPDNTVRFKEPDILFARSSHEIKKKFKEILRNFFPRYIDILTKQDYKNDIEEIRIEGHTSSTGKEDATREESYLFNAQLSQKRALSVLNEVYMLPKIELHREWLEKVIRANGLSFAKLIMTNGIEDKPSSRRVDFRVITKTEEKIYQIIKKSKIKP